MEVSATTGKIRVENVLNSESIRASSVSGDISLKSVRTNETYIKTTTGDIELYDVIASSKTYIKGTSSDVGLHSFDSADIYIELTTVDRLRFAYPKTARRRAFSLREFPQENRE